MKLKSKIVLDLNCKLKPQICTERGVKLQFSKTNAKLTGKKGDGGGTQV